MSGYRKAALTLAGLAPKDRAWMLERLGEAERGKLAPLLSELDGLGFEADMLEAALSSPGGPALAAASAAPSRPAEPAPAARPLDAATAQAIHDLLAEEPDWLVAALLRSRACPWREAFLRLAGPERRQRLQQALPSGVEPRAKTAQALVAALETRLAERLEAAQETPAEPAAPAPAIPWRKRFLSGGLPWRR
jgi:ribosomal protein L12E/L44/L45/RPP1/RPP2